MASQTFRRRHSFSAILLNLSAVICLALLLGFAIVVSDMDTHIAFSGWEFSFDRRPNGNWKMVKGISPSTWNVVVVVIGTAVGILASIAVSSHDEFLSRFELASPKGVPALFLRPLTAKRGLDQLLSGHILPFERAAITLLMLVTAFTSTATVALFAAHTTTEDLTNDRPSFSLEALVNTTICSDWSRLDHPSQTFCSISHIATALGPFMHRSAYVNALIANSGRDHPDPGRFKSMTLDGMVGDVTYRGLWTAGVGLNVPSYLEYSGPAGYFSLPDNYTLTRLRGEVYGTKINATCEDRTVDYDRYSKTFWDIGGVTLTTVKRRDAVIPEEPFGYEYWNITVVSRLGGFDPHIALGSNITFPNPVQVFNATGGSAMDKGDPVHVILVSDPIDKLGRVFECRYSGEEVLVEIFLPSPFAPLELGRVRSAPGSPTISPTLWPLLKRLVAEELHNNMELVARGFLDAAYFWSTDKNPAEFVDTLALVLSQSAQAAISLVRQMTELAHEMEPPEASPAASLTVTIAFQRLGGGSRGWLAVYGVLLLGSLIGLVRVLIGGRAVEFEAQDAGVLLAKATGDEEFRPTTRVRFAQGTGLIWGARADNVYHVVRRSSSEKEGGQGDDGGGETRQSHPDAKTNSEDAALLLVDRAQDR
jgi:hypothetical protein